MDLFINDGMMNFGIGSHSEEVFVGSYKILNLYTLDPSNFHAALRNLGFKQEPRVKTVWDNMSQGSPGTRQAIAGLEKTIWQVIEELKGRGLYLAERRPC